tara:strand:- start:305 stop:475 length:171 start_codon:yes stop_codon:yes gene_type:complete
MKVGDLIKLEYGDPALGLVAEILQRKSLRRIKIKWVDDGSYSVEREVDLVVINESR